MNRRDALKLLAGLPLLGFLKPEAVEAITTEPEQGRVLTGYATKMEISADEGLTWTDVSPDIQSSAIGPDGAIYIGDNGTIYVNGAFVNPPISNDEYWARWNGESWEKTEAHLDTV